MSIHQKVEFPCNRSTLFRALTDADKFAEWTDQPAEIELTEGGGFQTFGGKIEGRTIEFQENRWLVQAWRAADWPDGVYSIVRFELEGEGDQTRLTLDQDGHPAEAEMHLDGGWHKMYWEPLQMFCR